MEKLKPCPFCNGEAELDFAHNTFSYTDKDGTIKDSGFFYVVKCTRCGCRIGIYREPTMAIKAWNRRAEGKTNLVNLPSSQPEEVIPHRNYKYLSDYWCACGWHLGKKGEVKYCADCGRKVNWDG